MANITERVDEILAKRKSRVPEIEKKLSGLAEIKNEVQQFEMLKKQLVQSDGSLNPNSNYYGILAANPGIENIICTISVDYLLEEVDKLINKYKEIKERFSREFINISVVGPARQGKSRFLQSISGLDNRCIPAFTGGHCTGAASTIENGNNVNVYAEITFKTENEIRADIQSYVDIISNNNEIINSLSELRSWENSNILDDWIEKYVPVAENTKANKRKKLLYERYVEHYDEWIGLLGKPMETLKDENIIMKYVAQHNGEDEYFEDGTLNPKHKKFYKFVAVKSARIIVHFPYEDSGKIKLIDTVGLGSTVDHLDL